MKRKSEHVELESSAASEVARVIGECKSWKDRCGRAFKLVHRLERYTEKAVVTLASFDRITCDQLLKASKQSKLPGDHRVSDFSTSSSERSVSFFVTRSPTSGKLERGGGLADDMVLERSDGQSITFVPPSAVQLHDEMACRTAAKALHAACGKRGDVLVRVRPSNYELVLFGVRSVTLRTCRILEKWPGSFVDLENCSVVVLVDRLSPDL